MDFCERVIQLMKQEGLTQKELAEKINVTEASVSRYLKGERVPRIDVLVKLSNVFNVSIEYLQGLKEVDDYEEIKNIVARNSSKMTADQRYELAKLLMKD